MLLTSMLDDSCVYSSLPLEAVTIADFNYVSTTLLSHSLWLPYEQTL